MRLYGGLPEALQQSRRRQAGETSLGGNRHRDVGCGRRCVVLAAVCGCVILSPCGAAAHCSARDVLERHLAAIHKPVSAALPSLIRSAADVPVWKTISVGTFKDSFALRNTLDALNCGVGDGAAQVLARPSFVLNRSNEKLDLVSITAAQLGFQTGTVALHELYARAEQLGFELAPAEVGPQLRLQYADQPIGEFLIVGMKPIQTWRGESLVLVVANGGAGLLLLSQGAHAEIYSKSRILFVRRRHGGDLALGR